MMRALVRLLAAAGLCAAIVVFASGDVEDKGLSAVSERPPAPELDLQGPDGERIRLEDYRGKPLIVNFWATWCPPCRAEMPSMQRAWEQVRGEGIALIAVNVGESAEEIARFTDQVDVGFPLPMDRESRVVQSWPVRGLPTTFVVDPEGRLAYMATGEREWDSPKLLNLVRRLKSAR